MRGLLPFLTAVVAVIAVSACIPTRDNLADPAQAPQVSAVILVNGTLALQGFRNDSIQVAVNVHDPEGRNVSVSIVAFDPRTTTLTCPRFTDVPVATLTASSAQTVSWAKTAFPPPCFSDGPQAVGLKLRAVDPHGFFSDLTLPFLLLDHPPTLPPAPIAFVDPSVQTGSKIVGALDGSRAFDPEGDPIRFVWSQLSGAPALFLTTSSLPLNPVTLPNAPSATFRFGVTACDPWMCSAPAEVEVRESGALWLSRDTGVLELDGQYASAQSLLTSAGLITIPATGGTMFPASDGIYVPAPGVPLWRIGPDFSARAVAVPVQTNNLVLLGSDPANDRIWLDMPDTSAVHHFVEVTGTAGTLLSTGIQYLLAASNSPQDPLWLLDTQEHLFEQVAGTPTLVTLTTACSGPLADIYLLLPSADGSVYLVFGNGKIVHVRVSGVEDACQQPPAGFALEGAIPVPGGIFFQQASVTLDKFLVATPLGSGTASQAVPLAGPPGQIIGGFHDSVTQTEALITASAEWIYSDDLSTPLSSAVFPTLSGIEPLLDGAGRPWELDNIETDIGPTGPMRIWRFGASVTPVLSFHPSVPPQTPELASVDPIDGKLWVLQGFPSPAISAFDSLGPTLAQGAPLSIPVVLPGAPMAIRRDPGTCTISGGAAGCREAGFWIATATTSAGLWSVLRVDEQGTVQAGYGNGEAQQAGFGQLFGFQFSPSDGSLWALEPNDSNSQQQVWRLPVTAQTVTPFIDPDAGVGSAEPDVGLGIDASGSLWVADTQDTLLPGGAVKQVSPSGTMVSFNACSQFDTSTANGFPEAVSLTPFQSPPLQPLVTCAREFPLGMFGSFTADVGVERIDPLGASLPIFVSTTSLNPTGISGLNVLVDAASGGVILTYGPGTIRLDAGLMPQPFQPIGVAANLQFPIRH